MSRFSRPQRTPGRYGLTMRGRLTLRAHSLTVGFVLSIAIESMFGLPVSASSTSGGPVGVASPQSASSATTTAPNNPPLYHGQPVKGAQLTPPAPFPSPGRTRSGSGQAGAHGRNGPNSLTYGGSNSFGTYLAIHRANSAGMTGAVGIQTHVDVPASTSWTLDGWLWEENSNINAYWGVYPDERPSGPTHEVDWYNGATPLVGITGNTLYFRSSTYNGISGTNAGIYLAGYGPVLNTPTYYAITYDGTTVRPYINGTDLWCGPSHNQSCAFAASDMQIPASKYLLIAYNISTAAGGTTLRTDDMRLSSTARSTTDTIAVPMSPVTSDSQTTVLWHFDQMGSFAKATRVGFRDTVPRNPVFVTSQPFTPDSSGNGYDADGIRTEGYGFDTGAVLMYTAAMTASGLEYGAPDEYCTECWAADPVNTATGELRDSYTDISIPGRGVNLSFTRTYSSLLAAQASGQLGNGWTDNWNMNLSFDASGNPTVHEENGAVIGFSVTGTGCAATYSAPTRVLALFGYNDTTYASCTYYMLTRKGNNRLFFSTTAPYRLVAQEDHNGYITTVTYPNSSQEIITDQAGRTLTLTLDAQGRITLLTDPVGRTVHYGYDGATGDLTSVVDLAGHTAIYAYAQTGIHSGVTPPAHYLTTYKDAKCYAAGSACGGVYTEYDSVGRVVDQTTTLGITSINYGYGWQNEGWVAVTQPAGNVNLERYLDGALGIEMVGFDSGSGTALQTWYVGYDPGTLATNWKSDTSTPTFPVNGSSATWVSTINAQGDTLTSTDPLGRTTTYTYPTVNSYDQAVSGKPITIQKPDATDGVTTYTNTYDSDSPTPHGNLTKADATIGGVDQKTLYTYDTGHGRPGDLVQLTDPLGKVWTYTYDSYGQRSSVADPNSNKSQSYFDTVGRPICSISALGAAELNCSAGQPNHITQYTTNDFGDVTSRTDPVGGATYYHYDFNRNRDQVLSPNLDLVNSTFDFANNQTASEAGMTGAVPSQPGSAITGTRTAQDRVQSAVFDGNGRPIAQVDGLNYVTYDGTMTAGQAALGSSSAPFSIADVGKRVLVVGAGPSGGNLVSSVASFTSSSSITLANSASVSVAGATVAVSPVLYQYDGAGKETAVIDQLGNVTSYAYDTHGNRTQQQLPNGTPATGFCFDNANQLVDVAFSGQTCPGSPQTDCSATGFDVTFAYRSDGSRRCMKDATGSTAYAYDNGGRLTSLTNGAGQEVDYTYDARGAVTSIIYPGSARTNKITRTYQDNGWLSSVQVNASWIASAPTTSFQYNADGNLCLTTYGSGMVGTRSYDRADRLTTTGTPTMVYGTGGATACGQTPAGQVLSLTYGRDASGQVITDGATTSTYDSVPRLAASGSATYAADKADRLTSMPLGGSTESFTYDNANRLANGTLSTGTTWAFSFDRAGNRAARADQLGTQIASNYDQLNRPTSYVQTRPNSRMLTRSFSYASNGDGLRMSKSVDGAAVSQYAWDMTGGLPLLLQDSGTSFVYGPAGLPVAEIVPGGSIDYFAVDQLGSIRMITDASKSQVATYTYEPFGATAAATGVVGSPLEYAGQYYDAESGYYYMRARLYDPAVGQFLTPDPALATSRATYVYVGDNPLNATDPAGLFGVYAGGTVGVDWSSMCGYYAEQCYSHHEFGVGGLAFTSPSGAPGSCGYTNADNFEVHQYSNPKGELVVGSYLNLGTLNAGITNAQSASDFASTTDTYELNVALGLSFGVAFSRNPSTGTWSLGLSHWGIGIGASLVHSRSSQISIFGLHF